MYCCPHLANSPTSFGTSHHITSHITSHNTSHRTTHHITLHITQHITYHTSLHITLHHNSSHHITSHIPPPGRLCSSYNACRTVPKRYGNKNTFGVLTVGSTNWSQYTRVCKLSELMLRWICTLQVFPDLQILQQDTTNNLTILQLDLSF